MKFPIILTAIILEILVLGLMFGLEEKCAGTLGDRYDCYDNHFKNLVEEIGIQAAMSDLRSRYQQKDSFVFSQCHQLTHMIGRAAGSKFATVAEAFENGDNFCWSGFYHGVLEAAVEREGIDWTISKIDYICKDIPGKESYSFDYYNCVHGLGHGFMSVLNHELFESLVICDKLTGVWEQSSCWSGVFMENIISHGINNYSAYLKSDDPSYPCNAVEDKYKHTCFLMQTSYMLNVFGESFASVFVECEKSGEYAQTCYQGLGRDASGRTVGDIARTKNYCLLGKDYTQKSNCIIGAVKDSISYFHSDVQAKNLCASLPQELQDVCYLTGESYYKVF